MVAWIFQNQLYINYIKSEIDVVSYKFKLLTKISILNFYLEYLVKKNIINQKKYYGIKNVNIAKFIAENKDL